MMSLSIHHSRLSIANMPGEAQTMFTLQPSLQAMITKTQANTELDSADNLKLWGLMREDPTQMRDCPTCYTVAIWCL